MAKNAVQILGSFLVKRYHLTSEEATTFVTAIFDVIRSGLERDKQVKVKGLGTFKVSTVKARESVNVNTGERVVIEEHEKVTFTPDNTMKELVNRPFSQFETVIVNDGVSFDEIDEAAEEDQQPSEVDEPAQGEPSSEEPLKETEAQKSEQAIAHETTASEEEEEETVAEEKAASNEAKSKDEPAEQRTLNAKERFTKLMDESEPITHSESAKQPLQHVTETIEKKEEQALEQKAPISEEPHEREPEVTKPSLPSEPTTSEADNHEKIEQLEAKLRRSKCRTICCVVASIVAIVLCSVIGFLYGKSYLNEPAQQSVAVTKQVKDTTSTQNVKVAAAAEATLETATPSDTAVQTSASTPSLETINLETANQYPAIRYGAYKIIGVEKDVLKPNETMNSYCHRHLGRDMMGYFEAVNSDMNKQGGDTIIVPKLKLK